MKTINVALIGFGTVGTGVARILLESGDALAEKIGCTLRLKYICDKDLDRNRNLSVPTELLTDDVSRVIDDPEVAIGIELIGGTTAAYEIITSLLKAGKSVVTANKALLATRGRDIFKTAHDSGRCVAFEASCAGGIPIVAALRDGLIANRITSITGIVNGTCNYILTQMDSTGATYHAALKEAQEKGLAEADPTLDVSGGDSAHKLAILAGIAFGGSVRLEDIYVEGIEGVDPADLRCGAELGYRMKLLAIGQRVGEKVSLRVHPTFIPKDAPLSAVNGAYNAVLVHGDAVGDTLYYGLGAGEMPTASAVVSDIVDVALGRAQVTFSSLAALSDASTSVGIEEMDNIECRYYLRFNVIDEPGVLGNLAGILGEHGVSIASVIQHESIDAERVPLIIMTHRAREEMVQQAISKVRGLDVMRGETVCIRVLDSDTSRGTGE